MDYQAETIWGIIRIATWFGVIFVLLPYLTFPRPREESTPKVLLGNLLLATFLVIFISHALLFLHIYDFFSLIVALALVFILLAFFKANKSPWQSISQGLSNLNDFIFEFSEGRSRLGDRLRLWLSDTRQRVGRSLPGGAQVLWWGGLLWVVAVSSYLNLASVVTSAAVGSRESFLHLSWVKAWSMNQVYPSGVAPEGTHALISALAQVAFVSEEVIIRAWGGLVSILVLLIIYMIVRELAKDRGAALISAVLYGILAFATYFPLDVSQPIPISPLNTSLLALLPALFFLSRYLLQKQRRYLVLYFIGVATSFIIHPLAGLIALSALVPAFIACVALHWELPLKSFAKLAFGGIIATVVGNLFPLIGLALGKPIYAGELNSTKEFLGSLFTERTASTADTAVLPVLLIASAVTILLLVLLQRFGNSKEERVAAVSWSFLAVLLTILYFPAAFRIPELFTPGSVGVILFPVFCVVSGSLYGQFLTLGSRLLKKTGCLGSHAAERLRYTNRGLTKSYLGIAAVIIIGASVLAPVPEFVVNTPLPQEYDIFAQKVHEIKKSYLPFTWTIVSSDEEFPQVVRNGYFMNLDTFVELYSPEEYRSHPAYPDLSLPTPEVFIFTEKEVFIATDDDRDAIENSISQQERLLEWLNRFDETHQNLEIIYEDDRVKIVRLFRTPEEAEIFRQWQPE